MSRFTKCLTLMCIPLLFACSNSSNNNSNFSGPEEPVSAQLRVTHASADSPAVNVYIDGERASFVSPMAMFLFSVFAMFAIFQMIGLTTPTQLSMPDPAQLIREQGETQAQSLRDQIASLPADSPELEGLEAELDEAEQEALNRELLDMGPAVDHALPEVPSMPLPVAKARKAVAVDDDMAELAAWAS